MDMMMGEHGMVDASQHKERVEVILAWSHAFTRENPDVDISDFTPHMWAMAAFIMCHAAMRKDEGFGEACAIAAKYGLKHNQSMATITRCSDWALRQVLARSLRRE
jgi:hypothetical protein